MSLGIRTTRYTNDLPDRRAVLAEAARLAPDRVVLALWPPLKVAAASADVLIARAPSSTRRSTDLALRAADWLLFAAFPRLAGGSPRATVVSALTAAQLAATVSVIQRRRRSHPAVAQLLAPQAAWLAYASLVPFLAEARAQRRAGPAPT